MLMYIVRECDIWNIKTGRKFFIRNSDEYILSWTYIINSNFLFSVKLSILAWSYLWKSFCGRWPGCVQENLSKVQSYTRLGEGVQHQSVSYFIPLVTNPVFTQKKEVEFT